jgi:hypothetical protein
MLSKRLTTATDPPLVDIGASFSGVSAGEPDVLWFVPVIADGRIGQARALDQLGVQVSIHARHC